MSEHRSDFALDAATRVIINFQCIKVSDLYIYSPVEDPRLPLVFKVTEKNEKDVLGQVTIPLNDLGNFRTNQPKMVALQPHKKCPTPEGELKLEVWISGTTMSDLEAVEEEPTKKHSITSGLQKLKGKIIPSPRVSRFVFFITPHDRFMSIYS